MNRQAAIWIASLGVLALLLLILFARGSRGYQWREHYKYNSKDPYGTYVIGQLLDSYFPEHEVVIIEDSLSASLPLLEDEAAILEDTASYVFIGEAMYMSEQDVDQLLGFVADGNRAFIACRTIPYDLMFYLYTECDSIWWEGYGDLPDSVARFTLTHDNLKPAKPLRFTYSAKGQTGIYEWQYIDTMYVCDTESGIVPLGWMNDTLVNFALIQYGKGIVYLHTTPVLFTNIQIKEEKGLDYAGRVFSHLPEGDVYWDEHSRVSLPVGRALNNRADPRGRFISSESPLQFILKQPPLAWAWYLILAMGLLYMIFRARRKQRVIPVLEPNTNTSLEFISTIGRLYFLQNNHRQLALQQGKLFFNHVRERYQLQPKDENWKSRLAARSGIDIQLIDKISGLDEQIRASAIIPDETLIHFHQTLEQFYQQSK